MHRVLVIVFDHEAKADEGKTELLHLDSKGGISIYGYEVIAKKADGRVVIKQCDGHGTLSPFAQALVGSFSNSTRSTSEPAATRTGSPADSNRAETGKDFVSDVMKVMLPNRVAIVTEVEEEWPSLLDRHMVSIGGVVFRWTVSDVQDAVEMQES